MFCEIWATNVIKCRVLVLQFLDLKLLLWPELISAGFLFYRPSAADRDLCLAVVGHVGYPPRPLARCDSVEVGDRWVAPVRAGPEVSRSLSLRGSPAAGHLLPAFPSLFISP